MNKEEIHLELNHPFGASTEIEDHIIKKMVNDSFIARYYKIFHWALIVCYGAFIVNKYDNSFIES
jgi:hypothetical protein